MAVAAPRNSFQLYLTDLGHDIQPNGYRSLRLKILVYSHSFAPNIGGAEQYAMLLARGLARRHHAAEDAIEVRVATRTSAQDSDDSNFPFTVVRRPGVATLARLVFWADIVHVVGPCVLPMLLGVALRKRVVVEHHGYQAACPNGLLLHEPDKTVCPGHFLQRRYSNCLRCNASEVGWLKGAAQLPLMFPRRWAARQVSRNVLITGHMDRRLALPRSEVIYYGIRDLLAIDSHAAGGTRVEPQHPVTFAYVGRLVSEKGLPLLLEAAKRLDISGYAFQLKFVGDGPERSLLEQQARGFGLEARVSFTGYLSGEALDRALAGVAAVVMPSIWEETAGLAAIEQMMRARLVIVSDIGGMSEVVGDAGLKCAPGNAEALAACMQRVLEEPALVSTLSQKARQRATQYFAVERMVDDHVSLYRDLLLQAPPPVAYQTLS